jgi:hypothetical protein
LLDLKWFRLRQFLAYVLVTIPKPYAVRVLPSETVSGDIELETNLSAGSNRAQKRSAEEIDFMD